MMDRPYNGDLNAAIDVRRQLEETAATLERELFTQEQSRVAKVNELRVVNGQVAELADRVAKARLRESALADKVTHWVEYLKEEKTKFVLRESRKCAGKVEGLEEAINYQIDGILQKRRDVDDCLQETRQRRSRHKSYLRMLKEELDGLQSKLREWDARGQQVEAARDRLKVRRQELENQLAEKRKTEIEEKARYQQLEREMEQLIKRYKGGGGESSLSFDDLLVSNTDDGSTALAEGLLADIRRLRHNVDH